MGIQNIIFDWDGTLAKTLELWLNGFQVSLEQRDLQFEPQEIVSEFFHNHHLVPDRHPNIGFPAIAEEVRDYVFQASHSVSLYEEAIETLVALKDDAKRLSLVSSSARRLLENGMGAHNLGEHFISTVAGDDGYGHKPHPLPFNETLSRMGAKPSETLIIGDSHVDILAGKAAGCRTCLFTPEQNGLFHDFDHLRSLDADFEISCLSDLTKSL